MRVESSTRNHFSQLPNFVSHSHFLKNYYFSLRYAPHDSNPASLAGAHQQQGAAAGTVFRVGGTPVVHAAGPDGGYDIAGTGVAGVHHGRASEYAADLAV